ncbi:MAG: sensor histidine kinase [Gammaproteobacteria bacterium]|nr:sensor histidine kinase [Gammaproteobacteria bacterium]
MKAANKFMLPAVSLAVLCVALTGVYYFLRQGLLGNLRNTQQSALELVVSGLRGEITQFEIIASVLANDKELRQYLLTGNTAAQNQINRQLEEINRTTGALDTYLMAADGETLAASNWKKPDSFVGRNFSYRPYFQLAIQGQTGNFFGIGTSSNLRGFYIASPVFYSNKPIGAVVIKMRVDHLEKLWQTKDRELLLVDSNGVIFVSTKPEWRFGSMRKLTEAQIDRITATRRYPDAQAIKPLQINRISETHNDSEIYRVQNTTDQAGRDYLVLSAEMPEADWTVMLLSETEKVSRVALLGTLASGFGLAGVGIVGVAIYQRLHLARSRLESEQRNRNKLESAIAERTRDLQNTNAALLETQQKLVEAGRLAAIGRFSAGLSHEISQPLTAIHSYISNARQLLSLERYNDTDQKLDHISDLADRISLIIRQLKIFVRGDDLDTAPVSVQRAIADASMIMADQVQKGGASISTEFPPGELYINGDSILIQQLFVNLISNALDAIEDSPDARIDIRAQQLAHQVLIEVSDNGAGVPEKDLPNIFEPFYSTKETGRGLGLGLTIAQEIVSRFHGQITVRNNTNRGATFSVTAPLYMRS